jgi:hypothetical protein
MKEKTGAYLKTLGQPGNLAAPQDSLEWAIAVRLELISTLKDLAFNTEQLKAWLNLIKKNEGWRHFVDQDGKPIESYEDFCQAKPPFGLGYSAKEISKIIKAFSDMT